jgi:hypothetical protein
MILKLNLKFNVLHIKVNVYFIPTEFCLKLRIFWCKIYPNRIIRKIVINKFNYSLMGFKINILAQTNYEKIWKEKMAH